MIDTIKFEIPKLINPENLSISNQKTNEHGELILENYNLKNLKVTLNYLSQKTWVQGSIRKFKQGKCALDDLKDKDFDGIFKDIAKALKVKPKTIYDAKLFRVDIGFTLSTAIPIERIVGRALSKPRLTRNIYQSTGVEFTAANKKIILYDKLTESRKKGKCPKGDITFEGDSVFHKSGEPWANFLRVELQLTKISGLKLQLPFIHNVGSIFEDGFLRKELKNYFIKEISEIRFEHGQTIITPDEIDRKTKAIELIILMEVGKEKAEKILKMWSQQGILKKTVLAGIKKDLDELEGMVNDEFLDYRRYIYNETLAATDVERHNLEIRKRVDEILFGAE